MKKLRHRESWGFAQGPTDRKAGTKSHLFLLPKHLTLWSSKVSSTLHKIQLLVCNVFINLTSDIIIQLGMLMLPSQKTIRKTTDTKAE